MLRVDIALTPPFPRNQWTLSGWMRVAWSQIGSHAASQRGTLSLNSTRRGFQALWSMACACRRMFGNLCTKALAEVPSKTTSIVIAKHHDATPVTLAFGALTEEVYPHAKYVIKETQGQKKWTLVDFSTYASKHPGSRPERGVLQLFAQTCSLFWLEPQGCEEKLVCKEIYDMPKILERGNASTIFNAVEGIAAPLPMPSIKSLALDLEFLLVSEVPDNCSANVLKKAQTILEYQDISNLFYFHDAQVECHLATSHSRAGSHWTLACCGLCGQRATLQNAIVEGIETNCAGGPSHSLPPWRRTSLC